MPKKKTKHTHTPKPKPITVSQEDSTQAQPVLAQYHQIAMNLRTSFSREQAGEALAEMNTMPENAQIAVVRALAKELHVDAADILTAVYELSSIKSVRKEARRSLIRLEQARIYPRWNVPIDEKSPYRIVVPSLPDQDMPDVDEEPEERINLHGLTSQEVVTNFVEYWAKGDYGIAYDLLASDSSLREGLSRDEWIECRNAWAEEAHPYRLEPGFFHEREPQQPRLWLPSTASRPTTSKEIDIGWSIELDETPLSNTLPELPHATVIYEETGRHWFWTSYTLVQEYAEWRIQSMTDEGRNAQSLSAEELEERIQEHDKYLEGFPQKPKPTDATQAHQYLDEISLHLMQASYYIDALIQKLPLDPSNYQEAADRMLSIRQYERGIVYLEQMIQRFPEQRGATLRVVALVQIDLSKKYFEEGNSERAERFQQLAEKILRESLAVEDSFAAHTMLADLLVDRNEHLDEAEDHLLQAKALSTEPSQEARVELRLGEIAMEREQYKEALSHYQHVAELEPTSIDAWCDVAEVHRMLKNFEEAEANYRHAISLQPQNEDLYYTLSKMYVENNQPEKAIEAIEEGISNNPDSAILLVYLATMYMENGDYRQAEIFLDRAERVEPGWELVRMFREVLKWNESMPTPLGKSLHFPDMFNLGRPKWRRRSLMVQ